MASSNIATATPGSVQSRARGPLRSGWLAIGGLLALCVIPTVAGALRLTELAGGAEITPDNARFLAAPVPVVLHIVTVTVFTVAGAFQFSPALRRRRRAWHRTVGRIVAPSGLVAALSGLWMTAFYPLAGNVDGLVSLFRLVFGTAMTVSLVLAVAAIRRRDIASHGAWMTRGYAIGIAAGTQALIHIPWIIAFGEPGRRAASLLLGAGWAVNLAVAEWIIRRRRRGAARPARGGQPPAMAPISRSGSRPATTAAGSSLSLQSSE